MVDWNAQIINIEHSSLVQADSTSNVQIDVETYAAFPSFNELDPDHCFRYVLMSGIKLGVRVLVDGVERGKVENCVEMRSVNAFVVEYDTPSAPGTYDLDVEVYGYGSGEVVATYAAAIEVPSEPDPPAHDISLDAPSHVEVGEPFSINAETCCVGPGDCPSADAKLRLTSRERPTIREETVVVGEGECVQLGGSGIVATKPGDHKIAVIVGDETASRDITVRERSDSPIKPGPGDGINWKLLAAATATGAVVANQDETEVGDGS